MKNSVSRTHAPVGSIGALLRSLQDKIGSFLSLIYRSLHRKLLHVGTLLPTCSPFRGKLRIEIGKELQDIGEELEPIQEELLRSLQEGSHVALLEDMKHKVLVGGMVVDLRLLPKNIEVLEF